MCDLDEELHLSTSELTEANSLQLPVDGPNVSCFVLNKLVDILSAMFFTLHDSLAKCYRYTQKGRQCYRISGQCIVH